MFWLYKKYWIELFVLIIIASGSAWVAYIMQDTPEELEIKMKKMGTDLEIRDNRIEQLKELVETKNNLKRCISGNIRSVLLTHNRHFSSIKISKNDEKMSESRLQYLIRQSQICLIEYEESQ